MQIDKSLMAGSTTLLVLSLLSDGEKYGYQLREGTLYPILHALEKDGRVKSFRREAENGRERKYYRITPAGLELLQDKTEEWRFFSEKVNAVVQGCAPVGA